MELSDGAMGGLLGKVQIVGSAFLDAVCWAKSAVFE